MSELIMPTAPEPFEIFLTDILRGQFAATNKPDAATAKASTLAKVIVAAMKKAGFAVLKSDDLLKIGRNLTFTDAQLAEAGVTKEQHYLTEAAQLIKVAATALATQSLINVEERVVPLSDPVMYKTELSTMIYSPNSGAQRAAQKAADRSPALTLAKAAAQA